MPASIAEPADGFEGYATEDAVQRRRLVRAGSQEALSARIEELVAGWRAEVNSLLSSAQASVWSRRSKHIAPTSRDIDRWKRDALAALQKLPEETTPSTTAEYHTKIRPLVLDTDTSVVHVSDYELMRATVVHAPSLRLASRLAQQWEYPVPEPTFKACAMGTYLIPAQDVPTEPRRPRLKSIWHWFVPSIRKKFDADCTRYDIAMLDFREKSKEVSAFNQWAAQLQKDRQEYLDWVADQQKAAQEAAKELWTQDKQQWESRAAEELRQFNEITQRYESGSASDVEHHFRIHLDSVPLPRWCPRSYEIRFDSAEGILVVDSQLPHFGSLTIVKTKELKRVTKEVAATQKESRELSNQFSYLVILRAIWEVAHVDIANRVQLICFNGFVIYNDPATGRPRRDTIMSIAAKPQALRDIHLDRVSPETCFRSLKGVAAAQLSELVPIRPIIAFDKNDARFIETEDVLDSLAETNLATMDWQDFEHLIRELFEKEFSNNGAEVRVTQASRDRGVDAVVFDPDPLRGGKLVIQAKRYVNTVDVSAVRDLYGTVMNEGANKGILVTTSNYGHDSYDFCKDKPLTLINGANLLHLLSKHGYQLKIDLVEARRILKEK